MTRHANPELPGKILDTAEKIVAAEGHDALNMRRLAGTAGVTPPTLYYYFKSKNHLFAQLKLRTAKRLNGKLQRMDFSDPGKALMELAGAYIAFAEENPRLYRLFTERPVDRSLVSDEEYRTLHFSFFAAERALEALNKSGPSAFDPQEKAMTGWILLHGFVSLLTSGTLEGVVGLGREDLKKTFLKNYKNYSGGVRPHENDRSGDH